MEKVINFDKNHEILCLTLTIFLINFHFYNLINYINIIFNFYKMGGSESKSSSKQVEIIDGSWSKFG